MATLPPDLQKVLDDIDAADRAGDALVAGLSDAQLHWQPDGGRGWSVAQCLEHLATMNQLYGGAIRGGIDAGRQQGWARRGELASTIFGRWFVGSMEPPVKRRLGAPGGTRPGSRLDRAEILRRYHAAHDHIRESVRQSATIDANRATFQNPFIKMVRVRVGTGLRIIAAHDRRHLWQAERVIAHPDFPKA